MKDGQDKKKMSSVTFFWKFSNFFLIFCENDDFFIEKMTFFEKLLMFCENLQKKGGNRKFRKKYHTV